jgi:adenylate cyclase
MRLSELLPHRAGRLALGLALVVVSLLSEFHRAHDPSFNALDRVLYDARLQVQPIRPSSQVLIVDIDDRSLAEQGDWPWPQQRVAELLARIANDGAARTIGLDLVMPAGSDPDARALRDAVSALPVVAGFRFSNEFGLVASGDLPNPLWAGSDLSAYELAIPAWRSYSANAGAWVSSAERSGFFNAPADRDGTVRAMPLVARYQGQIYPSLALAVLQADSGGAPVRLVEHRAHGHALAVGPADRPWVLPMAPDGTVLVPVQGEGGPGASRFRHVSATDVLGGRLDMRLFQDRIVLIGSSSAALTDLRASASGERFTEVELQANLIAGAIEGSLRTRSSLGVYWSTLMMGAVGLLVAVLMSGASAPRVIGLSVLGASLLLGWNAIALARLDWVMPIGAGLLMLLGLAILNLGVSYWTEGRARHATLRLFGQYVAPQLVVSMADDPHHAPMQSQDKELTILFADIRGFTRMAERMDPQQLREVLNRFLTVMTEVVHAHRGTLDKYIGDAVMAFWGAPLDDPQHADHAIAASLAMQDALTRLNQEFAARGLPELSMGIGINTGVVRVGDMGSQLRRAYTAIGDAVNLAARLESLAKHHGIPVAIGDTTRRQATDFALEFFRETQVPGRDEPVRVWQPIEMSLRSFDRSISEHRQSDRVGAEDKRGSAWSAAPLTSPAEASRSQAA